MKKNTSVRKVLRNLGKCCLLICMMSLFYSIPVCAEQAGITPENFDYEWYLERHPDLAAVVSADDREAVWNFYQTTGKPAGWIGRITKEYLIDEQSFDYARYAAEYPDATAYCGLDPHALYQHYMTVGLLEGRKAYSTNRKTEAIIKIYDLAETITKDCTTDSQRINAVHDWMVRNIAYDYDNYLASSIPDCSYTQEGAILYGIAVCSGYAHTFSSFMDVLGIESEYISGQGNGGGHAWNRVMLNGRWLYIDVTWDDPVPDRGPNAPIRYTYYLVEDPTFGGTHVPDEG
ncbi:MAG: hypothetical protein K2N95_15855 [Lachnospiraceae bacterium]|nr:hypothetical protein [Lachnospiraceae bacterium]